MRNSLTIFIDGKKPNSHCSTNHARLAAKHKRKVTEETESLFSFKTRSFPNDYFSRSDSMLRKTRTTYSRTTEEKYSKLVRKSSNSTPNALVVFSQLTTDNIEMGDF